MAKTKSSAKEAMKTRNGSGSGGTARARNSVHSSRRCSSKKSKITLAEKDVIDGWSAVGQATGLSTDAEIGRYLLSLHSKSAATASSERKQTSSCVQCKGPLELYCVKCYLFCPQDKASQTQESSEQKNLEYKLKGCPKSPIKLSKTGRMRNNVTEPLSWIDGAEDSSTNTVTERSPEKASEKKFVKNDPDIPEDGEAEDANYDSDTDLEGAFDTEDDGIANSDRNDNCKDGEHTTAKGNKQKRKSQTKPEGKDGSDSEDYFCALCKNVVKGLYEHMAHFKTHFKHQDNLQNGKGGYKCTVCSTDFKSFYGLHKHMKIRTDEQRCSQCDVFFISHCEISRHKRKHKMEARRFCSWCMTSYPSLDKDAFNKHLKSHGYKYWVKFRTTEFLCPECGKVFKGKYQLDYHMTSHSNENPFPCTFPDCNKAFKNERNLKQHLIFHGEKKHQCEICGTKFFRNVRLQQHMQKHTGKQFQCDECSRWYYSKSEVKKHIEACHKGVRHFSCPVCDIKFYSKGSLKAHSIVHEGTKSFHCDQCPATFRRKYGLDKHVLRHTSRKPYRCEDCSQAYSCLTSYKLHRKKNHSDSVYTCGNCRMTFNLFSSYEFHKKMYHEGIDQGNQVSATCVDANSLPFDFHGKVYDDVTGQGNTVLGSSMDTTLLLSGPSIDQL